MRKVNTLGHKFVATSIVAIATYAMTSLVTGCCPDVTEEIPPPTTAAVSMQLGPFSPNEAVAFQNTNIVGWGGKLTDQHGGEGATSFYHDKLTEGGSRLGPKIISQDVIYLEGSESGLRPGTWFIYFSLTGTKFKCREVTLKAGESLDSYFNAHGFVDPECL